MLQRALQPLGFAKLSEALRRLQLRSLPKNWGSSRPLLLPKNKNYLHLQTKHSESSEHCPSPDDQWSKMLVCRPCVCVCVSFYGRIHGMTWHDLYHINMSRDYLYSSLTSWCRSALRMRQNIHTSHMMKHERYPPKDQKIKLRWTQVGIMIAACNKRSSNKFVMFMKCFLGQRSTVAGTVTATTTYNDDDDDDDDDDDHNDSRNSNTSDS